MPKMNVTTITVGLVLFMTSCVPQKEYHEMLTSFQNSPCPKKKAELESPLDRSNLVEQVLAVNPSLESTRQAWGAMVAKFPQVTSWDDPMFSYSMAPGTINSKTVPYGYQMDLSQKFPFPGKLHLRGQIALAQAQSANEDYEDVKVQLAAETSQLFDDYYLIERALETNAALISLQKEMTQSADAEYSASLLTAESPLQALQELGQLEYDRIALTQDRKVIIAKINALLHRDPSTPLPHPPHTLEAVFVRETVEALQMKALQNRPDLRAVRAQIQGARYAHSLAKREYFPDFELMGSYNTMWPTPAMFTMIGAKLNLPFQLDRRKGAVDEAKAILNSISFKHKQVVDLAFYEVTSALKRISQAQSYREILQKKIVLYSFDEVQVIGAGLESGQKSLLQLLETEKQYKKLELEVHVALAELFRQLALLDKAVGSINYFTKGGASCE